MRRPLIALVCALSLGAVLLSAPPPAAAAAAEKKPSRKELKAQEEAIKKLPEKYRAWLEQVTVLISDEERAAFIALEKDYQRDAFIQDFGRPRTPSPTPPATSRDRFAERMTGALDLRVPTTAAPSVPHHGPPADRIVLRGTRLLVAVVSCTTAAARSPVRVLLVSTSTGGGKFGSGTSIGSTPFQHGEVANIRAIADGCIDGDKLAAVIGGVYQQACSATPHLQKSSGPPAPEGEWGDLQSYSTDLRRGRRPSPPSGRTPAATSAHRAGSSPCRSRGRRRQSASTLLQLVLTGGSRWELFEELPLHSTSGPDVSGDELR